MSTRREWTLAGQGAAPPTDWTFWVVEGWLLGGAYPGAETAAASAEKIDMLVRAGIRTFINLTEADEIHWRTLVPLATYEAATQQVAESAGVDVECYRFPITDVSVPRPATLMVDILDRMDDSLEAGRPVFVHCLGGVGRTGTVLGCWLLRHGFATPATVLEVLAQLRTADQLRGHRRAPETDAQRQFVREWHETP